MDELLREWAKEIPAATVSLVLVLAFLRHLRGRDLADERAEKRREAIDLRRDAAIGQMVERNTVALERNTVLLERVEEQFGNP